MDARQHHNRLDRFAALVLGALFVWGVWQCYGDWLCDAVATHVA